MLATIKKKQRVHPQQLFFSLFLFSSQLFLLSLKTMSLSRCWSRSKNKSGEKKTLVTNSTRNLSCLHADSIISSLLSFPDYSPFSIACAFDRGLQKALAPASDDASVQDRLLDRTIQLASVLLDSTKRCLRERAAAHNSSSWFLPPELTVKVNQI